MRYPLTDNLGSILYTVDNTGNPASGATYQPFGCYFDPWAYCPPPEDPEVEDDYTFDWDYSAPACYGSGYGMFTAIGTTVSGFATLNPIGIGFGLAGIFGSAMGGGASCW